MREIYGFMRLANPFGHSSQVRTQVLVLQTRRLASPFGQGLRITEHTEYQFPKERTLWYSENRIADVKKIKVMRPRKSGYAIFPPKDGRKLPKEYDYRLFCLFRTNRYSVISAIGSRIDGILFRSFRNRNWSQKNTVTVN